MSDRCLINIDPRVLAIWDTASGYGLSYSRQQSKRGVSDNLNRRETYTHEFRYEDRDEIGNPLVSLLLSGSFSHDDNAICYKCISQRPMGNSMITIELYTRKQRCHDIMYSGNNYPTSLLQFAFHNDYDYRFCLHNEPSVRLLTNLPLDKMTVISQTTISNAFLWMKSFCILITISLKFAPKGSIDNNPALVDIVAWRRIGDKPLSNQMLTRFIDAYMRH